MTRPQKWGEGGEEGMTPGFQGKAVAGRWAQGSEEQWGLRWGRVWALGQAACVGNPTLQLERSAASCG